MTRDEIEKIKKFFINEHAAEEVEICDMALRCRDYDERLTAVMPADMKDWHKNNRDEWPLVAADMIAHRGEEIEWLRNELKKRGG
jgi:hypothetical protein